MPWHSASTRPRGRSPGAAQTSPEPGGRVGGGGGEGEGGGRGPRGGGKGPGGGPGGRFPARGGARKGPPLTTPNLLRPQGARVDAPARPDRLGPAGVRDADWRAIYLLPFSVPNQVMVLLHTIVGLALDRAVRRVPVASLADLPRAAVLARRCSPATSRWWRRCCCSHPVRSSPYRRSRARTSRARVGRRAPAGDGRARGLGAAAHRDAGAPRGAGRGAPSRRRRCMRRRAFTRRTLASSVVPFVLVPALALLYQPVPLDNTLPKDYSYVYGKERPFAPSLARTASGGAYDARSLSGSASCGTAGCHKAIYDEWSVSAHRYSAMDAAFQKVQTVMGEQNGPSPRGTAAGATTPSLCSPAPRTSS